jgi:hypothetical protein
MKRLSAVAFVVSLALCWSQAAAWAAPKKAHACCQHGKSAPQGTVQSCCPTGIVASTIPLAVPSSVAVVVANPAPVVVELRLERPLRPLFLPQASSRAPPAVRA